MRGALLLLPLGLALVAMSLTAPAGAVDHDCGDFSTQASAQSYYDSMGYGPSRDPERLDADHDGVACESNPCPCARPAPAPAGPYALPTATPAPSSAPIAAERRSARVVRVIDGDTIRVRLTTGKQRTVRLIGIDAPETSALRSGRRECGGPQARALVRRLAPARSRVTLVADPTQDRVDRFGRWLRYVQHGVRDVGRAVVAAGWAEPFVYRVPFRRLASYRAAARGARRARLGVHEHCGGRFHRPR